ncbi:glycoside hydrolase [Flavobacterium sp. LM5]|uniref:glycoside hydrolase family 3 protein n=1 Tax=Flavobacterium sp. LM5 TaxID=1938610 RepID=UPI00099456E0|nr:glycoside hydrolase family 3 N-terminal domain-containing protein [Flavobacterium sp. LM5]OOV27550.1 glycoside hydrolase [Flavobacterium sp. LM5]
MTTEQKIGQFFFPAVFINDSEENIQATERLIREYNIGGLTFFHSRASAATNYEGNKKIEVNDESYERLKALIIRYQKAAQTPLLMSIDAEWGLAMRIEKTPQYPYAITLGAIPVTEKHLIYEVGKQIGNDLKSAGIHYNLAPLADINTDPNNPVIGYRSFGEDKNKVATFALEYLKGMTAAGILGCLKHFPGHGNTNVDSHLGLPVLNEKLDELLSNELVPFIKGIENKVDSIMIGHLAVPALNDGENTSATLSKAVIEGLLRERLGYDGLIISDALNMHSVSKLYPQKGILEWEAFNAGNDVLCFAENVPEGIQEILKRADVSRIEASFERIWKCKVQAGLITENEISLPNLDWKTTATINQKCAEKSITLVQKNCATSITEFINSGQKIAKVSLYKDSNNPFFKGLEKTIQGDCFSIALDEENLDEKLQEIDKYDTLVIALFVPKAKPIANFEIEDAIINWLSEVVLTKKVVLHLFGNPYALQVLPNSTAASVVVIAYQDLPEFQEIAAQKIVLNQEYEGTLPVTLLLK